MPYKFYTTHTFDRNVKRCQKRGLPMDKLQAAIEILVEKGSLPRNYHAHKLKGKYKDVWECHIQPDWLLLWKQDDENLTMLMTNTGSHSDIFGL